VRFRRQLPVNARGLCWLPRGLAHQTKFRLNPSHSTAARPVGLAIHAKAKIVSLKVINASSARKDFQHQERSLAFISENAAAIKIYRLRRAGFAGNFRAGEPCPCASKSVFIIKARTWMLAQVFRLRRVRCDIAAFRASVSRKSATAGLTTSREGDSISTKGS